MVLVGGSFAQDDISAVSVRKKASLPLLRPPVRVAVLSSATARTYASAWNELAIPAYPCLGAKAMMHIPSNATAPPTTSQWSGFRPSMNHIQRIAMATYTPP